jgi:hypothetical protein
VYGYANHELDWVVPELKRVGATLNYLGRRREEFGDAVLFEAVMP